MYDVNTSFTYAYSDGSVSDHYQDMSGVESQSTNVIDLSAAGIKIAGAAHPQFLIAKVGVAATAGVSMELKLITATAADLTTGVKVVKMFRFLRAELTAGALIINEALGHFSYQRYLGLEFTPFTNNTDLTVAAYLSESAEPAVDDIDLVEAGS